MVFRIACAARRLLVVICALTTLCLVSATPAFADAPGTRPSPPPIGQGGPIRASSANHGAAAWQQVQDLPLLESPAGMETVGRLTATAPAQQATTWTWLTRRLNVGNWMVDAMLGGGASVLNVGTEVMQVGLRTVLRVAPDSSGGVTPAGTRFLACDPTGANVLVCTPTTLLISDQFAVGRVLRQVWSVLGALGSIVLVLLFLSRVAPLVLHPGERRLSRELTDMLVTFVIAATLIQQRETVFTVLFGVFNGIHTRLLSLVGRQTILDELLSVPIGAQLDLGFGLARLIFLLTLLVLAYKALTRLIKLGLLLSFAPLMPVFLVHPSGRSRFWTWFNRILDLLLEQTTWVFFLTVGLLLLDNGSRPSDWTTQTIERLAVTVVGTVVLGFAIGGERLLLGMFGGAAVHTGGGLASRVGTVVLTAGLLRPARRMLHEASQAARRPARTTPESSPPTRGGSPRGGLGAGSVPPPHAGMPSSQTERTQAAQRTIAATSQLAALRRSDPARWQQLVLNDRIPAQVVAARAAANTLRDEALTAQRSGDATLAAARRAQADRHEQRARTLDRIVQTGALPTKPGPRTHLSPDAQRTERAQVQARSAQQRAQWADERTQLDAAIAADQATLRDLTARIATAETASAQRAAQYEQRGETAFATGARHAGQRRAAQMHADLAQTQERLDRNTQVRVALARTSGEQPSVPWRDRASQRSVQTPRAADTNPPSSPMPRAAVARSPHAASTPRAEAANHTSATATHGVAQSQRGDAAPAVVRRASADPQRDEVRIQRLLERAAARGNLARVDGIARIAQARLGTTTPASLLPPPADEERSA